MIPSLSPTYTSQLILFYAFMDLMFSFFLAIKTSSTVKGLALSLSIILIGSEYYEAPIFFCRYLGLLGYTFPQPLSILNHILVALIFVILVWLAQIKRTWGNTSILALGPFLTAILIFVFHNGYSARIVGLSVLFMVTLEAISVKYGVTSSILNVKDYYVHGEHYDWCHDPRWLEKVFHSKREKDTMKIIHKYNVKSNVLDVGCGTGLITRNLSGNVVGLDINEWNIEHAKVNAPNARFLLGDCENMKEIPSSSVDFVVFTETLEHIPNPEKALDEIRRVLKVGGKAVITVPSKSLIWQFRKYLTTTHPHSEPFHRNFSKVSFMEVLKGFEVLEINKIVYGLTWIVVVRK
jgi:ubiquinone/menaquinone biosynthesis C-methylase UbiE